MSVGTHLRLPITGRTGPGDGSATVVVVDAAGVIIGAPGSTGAISADTLVATNKKLEFRSTTIYINSPSAGKLAIIAVPTGADDIQLTGGTNITGTLAVSGAVALASTLSSLGHTMTGTLAVTGKGTASVGFQSRATAVTATTGGGTTGIIPDDTSVAVVTSSVNSKSVTLPTPTPGVIVWIPAEATGYNLISSTPASVAINGGVGAGVKSAVSAKTLRCFCSSATTWIVTTFGADGTVDKLAAAS